jgi:hypothetical protein
MKAAMLVERECERERVIAPARMVYDQLVALIDLQNPVTRSK